MGKPNRASRVAMRRSQVAAIAATCDRDGRLSAALERAEHPVHESLVAERVLRRREGAELGDVGAGREGAPARTLDHHRADRRVGIDRLGEAVQPLVHRESEGVARLRPVEGDAGDARLVDLVEQFVGLGHGGRIRVGFCARA
jgi:hypothetical protein